jgi:protein-tyrosine phosphatase
VTQPFQVLFVCTGNVCRSPMAQELLRHKLAERLPDGVGVFGVSSAGTGALEGEPMTEYAAAALAEHGIPPDGSAEFRGRQLAPYLISDADLILTATREQRMQVATLAPEAVTRTFTIAEFALLLGSVGRQDLPSDDLAARARELTGRALALRGTVQPAAPQDLDIADPYQQRLEVFRAVAARLDEALTVVADVLAVPEMVE